MSSTPVKRRESPWGLPEGDTRQPQPHRCNDPAEDVIQVLSEVEVHFYEDLVCGICIMWLHPELRFWKMHVLKGIRLRQFQVHSSFFGDACVQSLGRSPPNHTLTCRLILQRGKRPYLNENVSSLLGFPATPICSICAKSM